MKKAAYVWLVIISFLSISVSAKNIDSDDKKPTEVQPTVIIISEGTSVYNVSAFENAKIVNLTEKNNTSESDQLRGEIFISEGTVIYNPEGLENVKITKLNSEKKIRKKESSVEKKKVAISHSCRIKLHPSVVTVHPIQDPETFSQNEKEKIGYTTSRTQSFSNVIGREITTSGKKRTFAGEKNLIIYQNPNITIFYFSGKYSVRPPTSTSFYI